MSIYDFSFKDISGKDVSVADFKGQVILLVNTASKCGFTPQYEGLEELYKEYKDQGLVVIGFPCNQFAEQEPGSNIEVAEFCKIRYGVSFPLSEKIEVRGENIDPIFEYLTDNTSFEGFGKGVKAIGLRLALKKKYKDEYSDNSIKWNFTKFLIDREGNIIGSYENIVIYKTIQYCKYWKQYVFGFYKLLSLADI